MNFFARTKSCDRQSVDLGRSVRKASTESKVLSFQCKGYLLETIQVAFLFNK